MDLLPIDPILLNNTVIALLHPISLSALMSEEAQDMNLDIFVFDVNIMKIIIPSEINSTNATFVYGNCAINRDNTPQVHYLRLFLLRIIKSSGGKDKLLYIM